MDNRRQYTRVLFSTPATLLINDQKYNCELLDVSLNGVLISHPNGLKADKHQSAELAFTLPDSQVSIAMAVEISHIEPLHFGLHCTHIDIDSITHLKRLVELNLGDDALLHRELAMLIHTPQK
ncbi:PilZ domain-containing protein [Pseudoalteromonas sp. A601]|uniref:PilZ domain-containing protein n=1 Tax=Pseudoalteromonas sp. A601 TaxID=1967839 RepID=UPI000B3C8B76|nr:PilZ domain-containing protein [Pseudoalteromonas sp. A601]OUS71258.1 PilZ domain-containing protein [Pseudoalteromonas sp. A601]